jgi:hypothetical protein
VFRLLLLSFLLCGTAVKSAVELPDTLTAPSVELLDTLKNPFPVVISDIVILGNKVTKELIILRELPFTIGDTIPTGMLAKNLIRARQNIYNTFLFNFVTISPEIIDDKVKVRVTLIERWYLWPIPVFELAEPNFNLFLENKDFRRLNYGIFVTRENFRGRKEAIRFKVQGGYTNQFALQYQVPYIDKKQAIGLGFTTSFYRNREIVYRTVNNKRMFFRDIDNFARQEFYTRVNLSYRLGIYNTFHFSVKYTTASVLDTVMQLAPDYFPNEIPETNFFTFHLGAIRDRRDIQAYPLKGYMLNLELWQLGVGVLQNSPDVTYIAGTAKQFSKLSSKLFAAGSVRGKYSLTSFQPYYVQRGLGYWGEQVRGYEYYIIDGQSWAMGRTNLKYQLIEPRVKKFNFLGSSRFSTVHYAFYLGLFADAGYVHDRQYAHLNPLANSLLFGYGLGLDYVTYYDQVVRFEYSFNKLGERGFFINFTSPF